MTADGAAITLGFLATPGITITDEGVIVIPACGSRPHLRVWRVPISAYMKQAMGRGRGRHVRMRGLPCEMVFGLGAGGVLEAVYAQELTTAIPSVGCVFHWTKPKEATP